MTGPKNNDLWKLDFLESNFLDSNPRFPHTKKLLLARNKNKMLKRFPDNKEDAKIQIAALKSDYFDRKFYAAKKNLTSKVGKVVKNDLTKYEKNEDDRIIVNFLQNEDGIKTMIMAKLVKCIISSLNVSKKGSEGIEFIGEDLIKVVEDKSNSNHPSQFYKTFCQPEKRLNNYISHLWNLKPIKEVLIEAEWSFRVVRGNLTKKERDDRKEFNKKNNKHANDIENEGDSDSEGSDEDDSNIENKGNDADPDSEKVSKRKNAKVQGSDEFSSDLDEFVDAEEDFDNFAVYNDMVVDSDGPEPETFKPDPNIDYNEVTDNEESDSSEVSIDDDSDSDSTSSQNNKGAIKNKHQKEYKLPELAFGYYSGGSDDESDNDLAADNDEVVKELTSVRKNRRGQRARQKIWAKKFGKEAKHIKSEQIKVQSEREQRQRDYEERCRRRELKKSQGEPTNANNTPLGTPNSSSTAQHSKVERKLHPSWEAKKLDEQRLQNVKFQGKKITFD